MLIVDHRLGYIWIVPTALGLLLPITPGVGTPGYKMSRAYGTLLLYNHQTILTHTFSAAYRKLNGTHLLLPTIIIDAFKVQLIKKSKKFFDVFKCVRQI